VGIGASQQGKRWLIGICALVCVHVLLSLIVPRGFFLTAFGDILQNIVLFSAVIAFALNIRKTSGRPRLFWILMTFGLAVWLGSQVMWTCFEVFLRQEAPNPFIGDVILFLHVVPMMAAVTVQPHRKQDDRAIRAGTLDFALLFAWWLFLYLFVVIPWQYVHPSEAVYGQSFDLLYFAEELVLAGALLVVQRRTHGGWRSVYLQVFGATLLYCAASFAASEAIDLHIYYTGSL